MRVSIGIVLVLFVGCAHRQKPPVMPPVSTVYSGQIVGVVPARDIQAELRRQGEAFNNMMNWQLFHGEQHVFAPRHQAYVSPQVPYTPVPPVHLNAAPVYTAPVYVAPYTPAPIYTPTPVQPIYRTHPGH